MTTTGIIEFNRPIILATASPARRELVASTGLKFIATYVDIDETAKPNENAAEYVERLALSKSEAVDFHSEDSVIITVDTAIGFKKEIIGKPRDEKHAREILKKLSNNTHEVVSSIVVKDIKDNSTLTETTQTKVTFIDLTPHMIDWYIETEEWENRAGAYAIQGQGIALIKDINGCFTNVIGISIPSLLNMLKKIS